MRARAALIWFAEIIYDPPRRLLGCKSPGNQWSFAEVLCPPEGRSTDQRLLEMVDSGNQVGLVCEASVVLIGAIEFRDCRRLIPQFDRVAPESVVLVLRAAATLTRRKICLR